MSFDSQINNLTHNYLCRMWEVRNNGYEYSSPLGPKRNEEIESFHKVPDKRKSFISKPIRHFSPSVITKSGHH